MSMNNSDLKALLRHMWRIGTNPEIRRYVPVVIWGDQGIGKSQAVWQSAAEIGQGVRVIDLRLSTNEVGDLVGLPRETDVWQDPIRLLETGPDNYDSDMWPRGQLVRHLLYAYSSDIRIANKSPAKIWEFAAGVFRKIYGEKDNGEPHGSEQQTVYALPAWFPPPNSRGFLFLDEINRSQKDVRQSMFQLVLDRKMHLAKLPKDWIIVAAANPPDPRFGDVEPINDIAFWSRFMQIHLEASPKEWYKYAETHDIDKSILSFVRSSPETNLLGQKPADDDSVTGLEMPKAEPSPRSWEFLSHASRGIEASMESIFPDKKEAAKKALEILLEMAIGIVGEDMAHAWYIWRWRTGRLVTGEMILDRYTEKITYTDELTNSTVQESPQETLREQVKGMLTDMISASMDSLTDALSGLKKTKLTPEQADNLKACLLDLYKDYPDLIRTFFQELQNGMMGRAGAKIGKELANEIMVKNISRDPQLLDLLAEVVAAQLRKPKDQVIADLTGKGSSMAPGIEDIIRGVFPKKAAPKDKMGGIEGADQGWSTDLLATIRAEA